MEIAGNQKPLTMSYPNQDLCVEACCLPFQSNCCYYPSWNLVISIQVLHSEKVNSKQSLGQSCSDQATSSLSGFLFSFSKAPSLAFLSLKSPPKNLACHFKLISIYIINLNIISLLSFA